MPRTTNGNPEWTLAVVIPCYRETEKIMDVLGAIGDEVRHIFVVDDACPDHTGDFVRAHCRDRRVRVVVHATNTGVGGAALTGYEKALEAGADIIVKLDGDGQMDPALIPLLVAPIINGEADYAKGNRFHQLGNVTKMPFVRLIGNLVLSFMSKMSSGYWNIFDPANGYTAIHAKVARLLPFDRIARGFFFESDMLFHLGVVRAVVADVPIPVRYGDEVSSLRIPSAVWEFTIRHLRNTATRILFGYFIRGLNVASVELVAGTVLFLFGVVFGALKWRESIATGVPATAGTVVLAALPVILGVQLLVAFLGYDTRNVPATPLHRRL